MPPISVLIKPSSSMCNMSCEYCFYRDEAQKRSQNSFGFMTEQTLKNVIRKTILQAEGMISYAYQGGEPTLRGLSFFKKAIAYQKQYNKKHIRVHNALQTNGYLIDEEWCQFLKENHFLVGLSIDGIPETHDYYRKDKAGGDTFSRINYASKLMDQYVIDYNILTVVTPQIASNIQKIYEFYKKKNWHYQQYIACLEPLGEAHAMVSYALTPEIYGQFLIELFQLWYYDFQHNSHPFIRQFENYVIMAAGYLPESCEQRGSCSIQNVVEADGSVYPCDFYMLDRYRLGNFNEDNLDSINARRKEIKFIERSKTLSTACRQCKYYHLCRGGCQRNRDFNPESGLYENYLCKGYQIFFEECYEKIKRASSGI